MKKAIFLVLLYLAVQIGISIILDVVLVICSFAMHLDTAPYQHMLLVPSLLASMIITFYILQKQHEVPLEKKSWSFISWPYMLLTIVLASTVLLLNDGVGSAFSWMPDLMKDTFSGMSKEVAGIISITLVGPIFEEILFRGAVMRTLLNHYQPAKAIIYSAIIFGVFHINPAQIIPAILAGLVIGTLYYRTGSLIPGIIVHIFFNTASTLLSIYQPSADSLRQVVGTKLYIILLIDAVFFFLAAAYLMKKITDKRIAKEKAANSIEQGFDETGSL